MQPPRRGAVALALWIAFWLLTQALGQAHGVLHAGLEAPRAAAAVSAAPTRTGLAPATSVWRRPPISTSACVSDKETSRTP